MVSVKFVREEDGIGADTFLVWIVSIKTHKGGTKEIL